MSKTEPIPAELIPEGGWAGPPAPRIAPLPPSEQGMAFRLMWGAAVRFGRSEIPNIFSVFSRNPRLLWAWLYFASRLMPYGKLRAKEREKMILRTAWNCRSRYEWGQHVEIALKAGLTDDEILNITRGPAAFGDRRQRALIQACDDLLAARSVSDGTWSVLREHYDEKLLIEIVLLIGHYEMLAGFLNSAGVPLEPAIEKVLRDFHRRVAGRA